MEITLNLQDTLGRITILTVELSHPLAWYRFLHSLNSSFILFMYFNFPRSFTNVFICYCITRDSFSFLCFLISWYSCLQALLLHVMFLLLSKMSEHISTVIGPKSWKSVYYLLYNIYSCDFFNYPIILPNKCGKEVMTEAKLAVLLIEIASKVSPVSSGWADICRNVPSTSYFRAVKMFDLC